MKKEYIKPSMTVVRLQQLHIICQSPGGYDGLGKPVIGGSGNQITGEDFVW